MTKKQGHGLACAEGPEGSWWTDSSSLRLAAELEVKRCGPRKCWDTQLLCVVGAGLAWEVSREHGNFIVSQVGAEQPPFSVRPRAAGSGVA